MAYLQVVTNGEKPSVATNLRSSGWRPVDAAWTRTNADFFRVWGNRRIVWVVVIFLGPRGDRVVVYGALALRRLCLSRSGDVR